MAGEEIKVLLTADAAQLQAGMEQGAASVQQSVSQMQATVAEEAAAFNATVQAKIDAMMRLNAAFSGSITSTEGLAEAESALDQAMSAGALTATEYAARTADLDAAELSMAASTDAATAAIEANTVAQEVNAVSSRTSYELGVLLSEAASGNFSRMKRSAAALGNSTGVLSKVFTPAGLAITGLAAAVGVFTYEVFKGEEQSNLFNRALLNSGGVIGVTEGQFVDMAQSITSMDTTIGVAREAMLKFAQSGKVGGEQLQIAGKAAVDFSALTGESMDKSVAAILKLEDKPTKDTVPLLYPGHFAGQTTQWPKEGQKRGNAIKLNDDTRKWLYPNGFYTVVRRFSSKEEPRRIMASVVSPEAFPDAKLLGFENHLNVFHQDKGGMPKTLAYGLSVFLNTTAVDENFRRFNGHTQVNATDLRFMKYPTKRILCELGEWAIRNPTQTQAIIDEKTEQLTG